MPSIPSSSLENVGCQQQGRQPYSRTRLRCWPENGVLRSRRNTHHRDLDTIVCGYERVMMGSVPYKRAYSRKQQVVRDFSRVRHSRCAHNNPVTDTSVRCQNDEQNVTHMGRVLENSWLNDFTARVRETLTRSPLPPGISVCS